MAALARVHVEELAGHGDDLLRERCAEQPHPVAQWGGQARDIAPRVECAVRNAIEPEASVSDSLPRKGLTIDEIARNLVQLTPPQLREQLSSYGLLLA